MERFTFYGIGDWLFIDSSVAYCRHTLQVLLAVKLFHKEGCHIGGGDGELQAFAVERSRDLAFGWLVLHGGAAYDSPVEVTLAYMKSCVSEHPSLFTVLPPQNF